MYLGISSVGLHQSNDYVLSSRTLKNTSFKSACDNDSKLQSLKKDLKSNEIMYTMNNLFKPMCDVFTYIASIFAALKLNAGDVAFTALGAGIAFIAHAVAERCSFECKNALKNIKKIEHDIAKLR